MMVSLIQSNFRGMGSGMVPPGLGFMLQNRGERSPSIPRPNALVPRKRPSTPSFRVHHQGRHALDQFRRHGRRVMQPQGHAQIVINLIDFDMTLQQAGDAPRIHHDGSTEPVGVALKTMTDGGVLSLEPGFPEETIRELERRGHTIKPLATPYFGGYQAILRDLKTGVYVGASESRKDGHAAGY